MSRLLTLTTVLSSAGAVLAAGGAAHAAVNARLLRRPPLDPPPTAEHVAVLVPARDEAQRVGPTVRSILDQRGTPHLDVIVLDHGSTDGTAEVVRAAAAGDRRLRLVSGGDALPPGWLGKPYACARLAEAAPAATVLVFIDADVVLAPDAVVRAVALLRQANLDLVSPYPRQLADGAGPRLVQPLLQWSWLTFLPLRLAERSGRPSLCAANGQLVVVDAPAYRTWGGHAAVRAEVVEDVALARVAKGHGRRVAVVDGRELATCRMYDDWPSLREGYTKSLWAAFGSPSGAAAVIALLGVVYVMPPVAAAALLSTGHATAALLPLTGYAAGVLGRVISARRTAGRSVDALAHPASIVMLGWLTARSWRARRRGGLAWRGRSLDAVVGREG